jgi:hypothetical protein
MLLWWVLTGLRLVSCTMLVCTRSHANPGMYRYESIILLRSCYWVLSGGNSRSSSECPDTHLILYKSSNVNPLPKRHLISILVAAMIVTDEDTLIRCGRSKPLTSEMMQYRSFPVLHLVIFSPLLHHLISSESDDWGHLTPLWYKFYACLWNETKIRSRFIAP